MGLESATYVDDLDAANPTSGDNISQGDDHLRLIKQVLQNTFPNLDNAMNASDEELNFSVGLTELLTTSLEKAAPAGSIMMWPTSTPPTQWLLCDGQAVSRSTYADLFSVIDVDYGNGDGSTTFNLPDFRGQFVRGTDNGAGRDPDAASRTDRGDGTTGDNVGTKQAEQLKNHTHPITNGTNVARNLLGGGSDNNVDNSISANTDEDDLTISSSGGGNETRPRNINMNFIIKY